MGFSRDTFYRYRELTNEGGIEAPREKTRRCPNERKRVDDEVQRAVLKFSSVQFKGYT
jgi:Winged helix-turn helix